MNTFDEHEDRIWALAAAGKQDQHMASASADGKLVVWQDHTQAESDAAADQLQQTAAQQQQLSNAIKVVAFLCTKQVSSRVPCHLSLNPLGTGVERAFACRMRASTGWAGCAST